MKSEFSKIFSISLEANKSLIFCVIWLLLSGGFLSTSLGLSPIFISVSFHAQHSISFYHDYIVPAGNAASWSCYILLMQVQALCVACGYSIMNSLPLGLGRYPFPVFFRIDTSDLLAGFSQNGDSLHFKRPTSNKPVHQLEYLPIYGTSSKFPHCKLLSALLLIEISIGQTLSRLSPRATPCKQLSLHTAFHGISLYC